MRSTLLILAFGALAVLVQTTVVHPVPIDVMLVLCVYLGLHYQSVGGASGAFFLGYAVDTFSGTDLGLNAFAMTLVFVTVHLLSRRLWIEGGVSNGLLVLAAAALKALAIAALLAVFAGSFSATVLRDELIGGAVGAIVAPLVFGALERTRRWMGVTEAGVGG